MRKPPALLLFPRSVKTHVLFIGLAVLALPGWAGADDLWPPATRYSERTVYAEWDTWIGHPGSMTPDAWSHGSGDFVGGTPTATSPSSTLLTNYNSRTFVLKIPTNSFLAVDLPNFGTPLQDSFLKGVFVQITYWNNGAIPDVNWPVWAGPNANDHSSTFANCNGQTQYTLDPFFYQLNNGWATAGFSFRVPKDSEWETFEIPFVSQGNGGFAYVDQIVVDTGWITIPEPTTVGLLAMGACLFAFGKRRSSKG